MGRACSTHGIGIHTGFSYKTLKARDQLGSPRRRCKDNIDMDVRGLGWGVWTGFL
jgi:hypothetical protein